MMVKETGNTYLDKNGIYNNEYLKGLSKENDFFNTFEKANLIKSFLINYSKRLTKSKMISLYGEWGCGKTSVLRYIEDNIKIPNKKLFFNTWKYEQDGNLILSLFEAIFSEVKGNSAKNRELKNKFIIFLKSVIKSTTIKTDLFNVSGDKFLSSAEEYLSNMPLYSQLQNIEKSFIELENKILGKGIKNKDNRMFIFIDDLDRCEPENILNLLSVIKLFFTLGKRTIFVCGVDKDAVGKSVNIKYGNIIKASEYLEKIFDISFNMPKGFAVKKALEFSFSNIREDIKKNNSDGLAIFNGNIDLLTIFFEAIEFTNPRHFKKVINKFHILKYFDEDTTFANTDSLLKYLDLTQKENKLYIIIYFFLIILFEFYPEEYKVIKNYRKKIELMKEYNHQATMKEYKNLTISDNRRKSNLMIKSISISQTKATKIFNKINDSGDIKDILKGISIFLPFPMENFAYANDDFSFLEQFEKNSNNVLIKFCRFILDNEEKLEGSTSIQIFQLIKDIENYL